MDEEKETSGKNLGDTLKGNKEAIIKKKEEYYDKVIDSLHLTTRTLDIIIVLLVVLIVIIFVTQAK